MSVAADHKRLKSLQQAWDQIYSRPESIVSDHWHPLVAAMQAQQQALLERGEWVSGPADLISAANLGRKETFHSAVVRWLLDPTGRHGLGGTFLAHIDELLWPNEVRLDTAAVSARTEVGEAGGKRRFDIIVDGPDFRIVVEVKVDSPESPNQLLDYWKIHAQHPGVRFVFLSPAGFLMQSAGPSAAAWRHLTFQDIRRFLDLRPRVEPVNQYLETLRRQFK